VAISVADARAPNSRGWFVAANWSKAIAEALRAEKLLVNPIVTVTIAEYHSRPIRVAGAVRKPLTFQAFSSVTLLDALTRAEGLSPEAGQTGYPHSAGKTVPPPGSTIGCRSCR